MDCLFVYGVVDAGAWADGGAALRSALAAAPGVEPDAPPQVLACGRLGVLLSGVPLADYTGDRFEAQLEDLQWLAPRARAHAAVISLAFAAQAVLPMRFGTLFSGAGALQAEFGGRERELLAELEAMRGQEEWTVRLCANPEALLEQEAAQNADDGAPPGVQYLLRRRLALNGRQRMAAELLSRSEAAHAALEQHALEVSAARTEVTGVGGGARSLLSRIYRIEQPRRDEFLHELERVAQSLAPEGLTVLHSGPWPPARPQTGG